MADNADVNSGTGITVATDKIGGVDYQRVKVVWGADGTATDTEAAAPMPVVQTGTLNVGTVTTVTAVTALTNALPAGANAIGKLAANSGVDIGDVDVTTVPADPFGVNADAASATGSISAKLRFIASTGIPVTGTVTVGSHAVTNAGTFVTQIDGAALTSLQLTDNIVAVDDAAFTVAVGSGVPMMGTVTADSVDSGDAGVVGMTTDRKMTVQATVPSGGIVSGAIASGAIASGAIASGAIAAGAIATGATSIAENEDVASGTGHTGVKMLVVQAATPADTAADLDYSFPQMSAGRIWTSTNLPSGSVASGAIASGAIASGAIASGAIALGAIARGSTSIAEDEDVASGTGHTGVKMLVVQQSAPADTAANLDYSFPQMSAGRIWTSTNLPSGAVASGAIASGAVASGAYASGAFAAGSIAAGAIATGATSIAENEDVGSASADTGVKCLVIQRATPADTAADLDYSFPQMSAGRIWTATILPSGSVASGAVASGAVASGAFASGALASGSIATGAIADMLVDDAAFTAAASRVFTMGGFVTTDLVDSGDTGAFLMTTDRKQVVQALSKEVTVTQTITRPANTTTYAVNDALADTAATAGGDTITSAAASSGGSGRITDVIVVFDEDAAVPLQGEILIFDSAFTTTADNSAFALSDSDAKLMVAKIPFALEDMSNNGGTHVQNLSIGFTCVGTANLRSIIRVKNAYIPTTNSSVLTIRYKIIQA